MYVLHVEQIQRKVNIMKEYKKAVLYHGGCPDGFGGAYSAWKKLGDTAKYIPLYRSRPVPNNLNDYDIYFIDFCYPKAVMETFRNTAHSVTVLDHHEGVRDIAKSFPGVFDSSHSGAIIAWNYFNPNTPVPTFLKYIEDGDLYKFILPDSRKVLSYVYSKDWESFDYFDKTIREMEDKTKLEEMVAIGNYYLQYRQSVIDSRVQSAERVVFEGYTCYLASASGEFVSDVGHVLANKLPPIALIVSVDAVGIRISLRSNGTVDVSALARKYGGNGHPAASGIRISFGDPIPWKVISENENTVN